MVYDKPTQVMINIPDFAKIYHWYDSVIQESQLTFHLKVLVFVFYKKYSEKPMIATSNNLGLPMARAVIRFFLSITQAFQPVLYCHAASALAIKNKKLLVVSTR